MKAVTTSDGAWAIQGFFKSKCHFCYSQLQSALVWPCLHERSGHDSVIGDDLYSGTTKSMEGYLAAVLFAKALEEGCKILVNWQDQDSSSDAVYRPETSARVMKCGGHVGWARGKALQEVKSTKEFTSGYNIDRHAS